MIEIAHFVAVPAAGSLLADRGADVIKIELPPKGELYRRSRPVFSGFKSDFPEGPGFHLDNRGKRSAIHGYGHGGEESDRPAFCRYMEVSMLPTGLDILGCDIAMGLVAREPIKRHDRKATANALWNSYEVAGGRWIMLVMIDPTVYWPRLCAAVERPDLLDEPALRRALHARRERRRARRGVGARGREDPSGHLLELITRPYGGGA